MRGDCRFRRWDIHHLHVGGASLNSSFARNGRVRLAGVGKQSSLQRNRVIGIGLTGVPARVELMREA